MCGHGIIGLVTVGLECGLFSMPPGRAELRIDTPAGRVAATPQWQDGRVAAVSFRNVPSFALLQDLRVAVPGLGEICCDIAFGGAFYALVDVAQTGLALEPQQSDALIAAGRAITRAIMATQRIEQAPFRRPCRSQLSELRHDLHTVATCRQRSPQPQRAASSPRVNWTAARPVRGSAHGPPCTMRAAS